MRWKYGAAFTVLAASMAITPSASAMGPKHQEGDRAFDACVATYTRQLDRGMVVGGGPKSTASDFPAPTNCDHFWQAPEADGGVDLIGNHHWPPPGPAKK
jgi:hypothetical protein